jgi:hypothetical protein
LLGGCLGAVRSGASRSPSGRHACCGGPQRTARTPRRHALCIQRTALRSVAVDPRRAHGNPAVTPRLALAPSVLPPKERPMNKRTSILLHSALVSFAAFGLTACVATLESDALPPEAEGEVASPLQMTEATGGPAHEALAITLASALRDATVRRSLHAAMSASPVKEGKLHLQTYLRGEGRRQLSAMAAARHVTEDDLARSLDAMGSLEIYLPVKAHRAAWSGGEEVIVVSQAHERDLPFGVDLDGKPVELSLKAPPTQPVISIVPAESFNPDGKPHRRSLGVDARPSGQTLAASFTGFWINEVHVGDVSNYEPWTKGDPEFEMYLQNATTRGTVVCAEEDSSVEPYAWNMDSDDYTSPFLIAADSDLPANTPVVLAMYEDDDTRCVIKTDKDYIKLATDALMNASSAYQSIATKKCSNGSCLLSLYNTYVAVKSIVLSGDDFVGVSAGLADVGTTAKTFQLKDTNMNNVGSLKLQWKTDVAH